MAEVLRYGLVLGIGAAVGAGEIITIFRDAPGRTLRTRPAIAYMLLNAAAAGVTLALTQLFGWSFGITSGDKEKLAWVQLLASGFGAMAILRSSLVTFKTGDQPASFGPGALLLTVLTAVGRAVDRTRAEDRSARVASLMSNVSFERATAPLPAYCFGLMQNLSEDDQRAFGNQILLIQKVANDHVQALLLGLALMNVVGFGVLQAAVKELDGEIKTVPPPPSAGG